MRIFTPLSPIRIFISYRREDSAASSGRLYNYLSERFGEKHIFKDIFSMEGGDRIKEKINAKIESSDVMLVVIGEKWVEMQKKSNKRHPYEKEDWLQYEIEAALNKGLIVIPVLVDKASMPDVKLLPGSLKQIYDINAAELTFKRYEYDIKLLVKDIKAKVNKERKAGLRLFKLLFSTPIIIGIVVFGILRFNHDKKNIQVGEKYGGGIVFFVDASKEHGLTCAPTDIGTGLSWANSLAACRAYRGGGFKDWRLPTKDETSEMYSKRNVIGNFSSDCNPTNFTNCSYWTSTELQDTTFAWNFYFTRGILWDNFDKKGLARVRAVRNF